MDAFDMLTEEQRKMLLEKLYVQEEMSYAEVGEIIGRSGMNVRYQLVKYKIPLRGMKGTRHKSRTSLLHDVPLEDWKSGIAGVANKHGIPYTQVYNFYRRYRKEIDTALGRSGDGRVVDDGDDPGDSGSG